MVPPTSGTFGSGSRSGRPSPFSSGVFGPGAEESPISRSRRRRRTPPNMRTVSALLNLGVLPPERKKPIVKALREIAPFERSLDRAQQTRQQIEEAADRGGNEGWSQALELSKRYKKEREMTRTEYANLLVKKYKMSPTEAMIAAEATVLPEKDRSRLTGAGSLLSPLELGAEILSVPGNVLGNTLLGVRKGWQGVDPDDPWGWRQAWESTKGLSAGVTKSPWKSHSLEEYYANVAADPNASNFLKNRFVQFGLVMASDPMMYLSFGATPASKLLANSMLAKSYKEVGDAATKMLAGDRRSALIRDSGLIYKGKGHDGRSLLYIPGTNKPLDHGDLVEFLTDHWNQPRTLTDALGILRNRELARKQSELWQPGKQFAMRRAPGGPGSPGVFRSGLTSLARKAVGKEPLVPGEAGQPLMGALAGTAFRMGTGVLLPGNVRGGAGIRFAGREIPGTAAAGAKVSKWTRGKLSGATMPPSKLVPGLEEFGLKMEQKLGTKGFVSRALMERLTPRWQLKLIADDRERAMSMIRWDRYRWAQSDIKGTVGKKMVKLGKAAHEGELIPAEQRIGLHTQAFDTIADDNLRKLRIEIDNVKKEGVHRARQAGVPERRVENLWEEIAAKHQDPLAAAAEYSWRVEAQAGQHEFITDILGDPLFAKAWVKPKEGQLPEGPMSIWKHYGDEGSVPAEYMPFQYGRKDYIVKRSIHESLEEMKNGTFVDNELGRILKMIQTPQNFWKTFATVPNPSFHVMNFLGAVWNNLASGVYNPADYVESLAILWNARLASFAEQGRKTVTSRGWSVPQGTPIQKAAFETYEAAAARGGLGRESIFQELVAGTSTARLPGELGTTERVKETLTGIPGVGKRKPGESRKRATFRQARRGAAAASVATTGLAGAPLAAALMMPEIAGVGRAVGTTIEDAVRLAPFLKAGKNHSAWEALDAMGPPRVPGFDYTKYSKADREIMRDVGAQISTKFQFDYGDLTPFERRWAKTVFPFWTFYKNNFLLQAGWAVNRPRFVYGAQALENFIQENAGEIGPMENVLPAYFDNLDAFQIPVPESLRRTLGMSLTDPVYLNPKLPFVSLNMFPAFWNVANSNATTPERMAMILAPVFSQVGAFAGGLPFKVVLESYVNYNLGLNQRIDYSRANSNDSVEAWVPAPKWVEFIPPRVRDWLGAVPVEDIWPSYPFDKKNLQTNKESGKLEMLATSRYVSEQLATPFITNLGRSALYTEPGHTGDKGTADLVSWLSGVRLMPVDIPKISRAAIYDQISMLESEQARRKQQGKMLEIPDLITLKKWRKYAEVLGKLNAIKEMESGGG